MDKSTSMLRIQVWTERVRECHNSGMTVKDWCGQNNINLKTYYYWQRIRKASAMALKRIERQPPCTIPATQRYTVPILKLMIIRCLLENSKTPVSPAHYMICRSWIPPSLLPRQILFLPI